MHFPVTAGAKASQSRVQDSDSDDGEMKTDMKRAQEKQLQDAYEEIACILKGNQESGNTFFDFMGSGAAYVSTLPNCLFGVAC